MDVDRFVAENKASWDRLAHLTSARKRLKGDEVQELARLYQKSTADLAYAQTHFTDTPLRQALTYRVAESASVLYSVREPAWRSVQKFFSYSFPLAVWQARWTALASAVALFAPALAIALWVAHSHAALSLSAPAAVRQAYVSHDFRAYYSSEPSLDFALQVYTNNVLVAFEAFAGGITLGVLTLVALAYNGLNLGEAAGLFYAAHRPAEFWGLITPHGLLETTSVVLAGAAGLKMGWALVKPGDRLRRAALSREARGAIVIALGTVVTLGISGAIEGFVTGSALPTAVRVGLGIGVEICFLAWVVTCGRRAAASMAAPTALPAPPDA